MNIFRVEILLKSHIINYNYSLNTNKNNPIKLGRSAGHSRYIYIKNEGGKKNIRKIFSISNGQTKKGRATVGL